jgi:penicillin-insensitive murein DD-endopeptidase
MPKSSRSIAVGALGLSLTACFGVPSPLAPSLRGSVGLPNQGVLTDAAELPQSGIGYERYRTASTHYWGVPRLVAAIKKAAASVARFTPGGAPLAVGDLSSHNGGKIPNHASHRTGRDVDLLYYFTDVYGHSIKSPGFVSIGSDGLAQDPTNQRFARLDIERQWLLAKALLTDSQVDLLWMFVSRDVEAMLIQHARALGEPIELVWRAEQVLHQPRDSAPHDDHMHVRIACTEAEALEGCEGGGPHWPWFPDGSNWHELNANLMTAIANDEPIEGCTSLPRNVAEPKLQ